MTIEMQMSPDAIDAYVDAVFATLNEEDGFQLTAEATQYTEENPVANEEDQKRIFDKLQEKIQDAIKARHEISEVQDEAVTGDSEAAESDSEEEGTVEASEEETFQATADGGDQGPEAA